MADITDVQNTYDSHIFKVACQDVARIVSILSLESDDIRKIKPSLSTSIYEKGRFFGRFFYLVFYKGFTPTVFDTMPYWLWKIITIIVYFYRLTVLPTILRVMGFGKHASWTNPQLGVAQPSPTDPEVCSYQFSYDSALLSENRLAVHDFGDKQFEYLISILYNKEAHLSPHSQSPGHPFVRGFPGNFLDHLIGVYKILVSWRQPQYVARAGLFHSLYGTFDYRASFFDLRHGRDPLREAIGSAAEEIAFLICTSDRLGLMRDLMTTLYGRNAKSIMGGGIISALDGNPYPGRLPCTLTEEGYPLRNHITQKKHVIPPDLFAQFVIVMIADFMEQGALGVGSDDADMCLFQFSRFRFYNDLILFVTPYLRVLPKVWFDYLGEKDFVEPKRNEIVVLKRTWKSNIVPLFASNEIELTDDIITTCVLLSSIELQVISHMVRQYPYLLEPRLILACAIGPKEIVQVRAVCGFIFLVNMLLFRIGL